MKSQSLSLLELKSSIAYHNKRQLSKIQVFKNFTDYIKGCENRLFSLSDVGENSFDITIPGAKIRGWHFTMPSQKEDLLKFYRIQSDVNNRSEAIDLEIALNFDGLGNVRGLNNLPNCCDTLSDKESVEILILNVIEKLFREKLDYSKIL